MSATTGSYICCFVCVTQHVESTTGTSHCGSLGFVTARSLERRLSRVCCCGPAQCKRALSESVNNQQGQRRQVRLDVSTKDATFQNCGQVEGGGIPGKITSGLKCVITPNCLKTERSG